jgi:tRNA/tmRNA/rRNA uracil-C5-methylase (TrmA/RlmC/RlmD family)
VLAPAVGSGGQVLAIESDPVAVANARANLAGLPQVAVRRGRVTADLVDRLDLAAEVVVLDPPRSGAGAEIVAALLRRPPRAVAYVACDPAALARDVRAAVAGGYRLAQLRAVELFPMTHHVECVALLTPATPGAGQAVEPGAA